jgi:hypothetical protein
MGGMRAAGREMLLCEANEHAVIQKRGTGGNRGMAPLSLEVSRAAMHDGRLRSERSEVRCDEKGSGPGRVESVQVERSICGEAGPADVPVITGARPSWAWSSV